MTSVTASTLASVQAAQSALSVIATLGLANYLIAPNCTYTNGSTYDYIVIGSGSAGSVLGNRLSANGSFNVLVLEAGGDPPLEAKMPGTFTVVPVSSYDFNTPTINDNTTAQWLVNGTVGLTQGKMVGGSSSLNHMIHIVGNSNDYNQWAKKLGDDSWNYTNLLNYIYKMENLIDPYLRNSSCAEYHGTDGMMPIKRQTSSDNEFYLEAFAELGHPVVDDITEYGLGICEPLFNIHDDIRQSNAVCYLGPAVGARENFCLGMSSKVDKILIENNVAVGVQVTTAGGLTYVLYASKEVIVSAGAIHSPQILMLSGIGPKEHLESLSIPVVADLPVGENFMDHSAAVMLLRMNASTEAAAPQNPGLFPVPTTTLYAALNSSQTYPDYQAINLLFPAASSALTQLCANVFKYNATVCDAFYDATQTYKSMYVVFNLMMPKSTGKVLLASANSSDEPLVYTGTLTNEDDVDLMTAGLEDFAKVLNTTNFLSVNASLVDPGLCPGLTGTAYWKCYALSMSATMWHYSGTCSMGTVVDTTLKVIGVDGLRVCDASVMPTLVSGNINAAVTVIGEKLADMILNQ